MAKEAKKAFKDMTFDEKIVYLDDKIGKTKKKVEQLSKSLNKAKKDVINLENQKKAILYDNDHPEEN